MRRAPYLAAMVVVALLTVGNLLLIFSFSSESREESGARSRSVTEAIARIVYSGFDDLAEAEQQQAVENLHRLVRKGAHFSEFALLGCLTAILVKLLRRCLSLSVGALLTVGMPAVFCFMVAVADETYQIFTNRGASPLDVCIDGSGALCGVLLVHGAAWLFNRFTRSRNAGKETRSP